MPIDPESKKFLMSAGGTKVLRRRGYRGWMLHNMSVDQVITVQAHKFNAHRLTSYPPHMVWPTFNDFEGCEKFVDAVMARDAATIARFERQYPEHDFGLGQWWVELKAQFVRASAVTRRTLRTRHLAAGRELRVELEENRDNGARAIVAGIYRGRTRIAQRTLVSTPGIAATSAGEPETLALEHTS